MSASQIAPACWWLACWCLAAFVMAATAARSEAPEGLVFPGQAYIAPKQAAPTADATPHAETPDEILQPEPSPQSGAPEAGATPLQADSTAVRSSEADSMPAALRGQTYSGETPPACKTPEGALGVSRVVDIDASAGPIYGRVSRYATEASFLGDKEVLLTFDDGPSPAITNSVLATLDRFCTKATFFMVGRMALAYPDTVRSVLDRGHTVAAHTLSHPLSLNRIPAKAAIAEIEHGFAALALAAGKPISPFFRFPGLGDGKLLLTYLKGRQVATISVDVISDDSFIASSEQLIRTTLARIEQRRGGIVLFHDIKPQTARALPAVLTALKSRGYRIVHMRSVTGFKADAAAIAAVEQIAARRRSQATRAEGTSLTPAGPSGTSAQPYDVETGGLPPVSVLAPQAKPLVSSASKAQQPTVPAPRPPKDVRVITGWTTSVRKSPEHGQ